MNSAGSREADCGCFRYSARDFYLFEAYFHYIRLRYKGIRGKSPYGANIIINHHLNYAIYKAKHCYYMEKNVLNKMQLCMEVISTFLRDNLTYYIWNLINPRINILNW